MDLSAALEQIRQRKAIAAIVMFYAFGHDLSSASAGTPDAIAAFRVADALIASGYGKVG